MEPRVSRAITEIDADLAIFYEARRKATIAEYSTDSGQGRTSAKRDLAQINKTIDALVDERNDATGEGGQTVSVRVDRGGI